jgi:ABC-type amino acid transport substrate-binding protein
MRKLLILGVFLLTTAAVWACGDKLMLVMGVRLSQLKPAHPASILAYQLQNSASSPALRQVELQPGLTKAGHKFQVVEDASQLADALKTGKFDLVMADVSVADELTHLAQSAPSHPAILPVAFNRTKAEQSAAQKKYHCLLRVPGDTDHYLAAIDQAMEWKAKSFAR